MRKPALGLSVPFFCGVNIRVFYADNSGINQNPHHYFFVWFALLPPMGYLRVFIT